jgi:kynureninase
MTLTRQSLEALDRDDPLRGFRERFELPEKVVYLDGNSLGALAGSVRERVADVVEREWGRGLIRSWNEAGWIDLPRRAGDKIARLIGAAPGEVIVADSTSVNLFKVLSVALRANPGRRLVVSERANFPTDLHIAQGLLEQLGASRELVLVDGTEEAIESCLAERGADVAAVMLTHVHYTTARMYDMARVTRAARAAGAFALWDLSHSAGVVPVDLETCGADFAVGCGYKHLNGGPGAPAFLYVAARHQPRFTQPLSGWMGHARPFDFDGVYEAAPGVHRYLAGTPPVVAAAALEASVDLILEAPMEAIRAKSLALADTFIALMDQQCADLGFELLSPRSGPWRGSHVSYRHAESYALMQALIAAGVIGDCRPPDLVRFGFAPLYTRYVDLGIAVAIIAQACGDRAWERPVNRTRNAVT